VSIFKSGGRQRLWGDIADDPQTPYMVGRLLGANEMAVVLLHLSPDETAQKIADALEKAGSFFVGTEREPSALSRGTVRVKPGVKTLEPDTEIQEPKLDPRPGSDW
jgi:hypothetical protein